MATEYVKLTLVVTVEAESADYVEKELNECLDLIGMEHQLYGDDIEQEPTDKPAEADDEDDD
jgi:hypothetical protein